MELNSIEGKWEEVPTEDLWEDGEISNTTCMVKIYDNVVVKGNWKLIRQVDYEEDSLEWANTPTSNKNIYDAITKATIRIQHENKKCESKG